MSAGLDRARQLDRDDPLARFRDEFWIPPHGDGGEQLYFCGHSLGLQPRRLEDAVAEELQAWKTLGVEGHLSKAPTPGFTITNSCANRWPNSPGHGPPRWWP